MKTTSHYCCSERIRKAWLTLAFLLLAPLASYGVDYQLLELGALGGKHSEVEAINAANQVVGTAETAKGQFHAFLWTPQKGMQDLGTLGGNASRAIAINDVGQIIGISDTATGEGHAFIWHARTGMRDLGTLGGDWSKPSALNNRGQVVGKSHDKEGETHSFLWSQDGGMKKLEGLGGDGDCACGINEAGEIIGISYTKDGYLHAYYCVENGKPLRICPLGSGSQAHAINASGKVIGGYYRAPNGLYKTFSWTAAGGLRELEQTEGRIATVKAVSSQGYILGSIEMQPNKWRACVWDAEGKIQLLPAMGQSSCTAAGIGGSESVVVGCMCSTNGKCRAFVWSAKDGLRELPLPDATYASVPVALNGKGTIVGHLKNSVSQHACLWHNNPAGKLASTIVAEIK